VLFFDFQIIVIDVRIVVIKKSLFSKSILRTDAPIFFRVVFSADLVIPVILHVLPLWCLCVPGKILLREAGYFHRSLRLKIQPKAPVEI
jgi:hypothetical protein